ncbi:MAG: DEAD/DEAH box helicase [Patescibacteria group bacterium]
MINKHSFVRGASTSSHTSSRFAKPAQRSNSSTFTRTTTSTSRFGTSAKPAYRSSGGRFSSGSTPSRFSSPRPSFGGSKFGAKRGGGNRGKSRGDRIDASRFIQKAVHVEEKPYVSKHTFSDFPFNPELHKNIARVGYIHPRPIQDQSIPTILKGGDVFGMANTGTGKTAAFLLPLIEKISKTKGMKKGEKVLIMAPTRELALQIESDFRNLAFGFGMFSVACVGGLPIMKQIKEIKLGVSFVIGTPGRLRDLIDQKVLDLSTCNSVVLDEADRMLDMGFRDDMVYIIGKTAKERQTLFFSATLSPEIKKLTEQYLINPAFISVLSGETAKNIDQDVIRFRAKEEKFDKLHEVLNKDGSDKVLIFREMKHSVDTLAKELSQAGFKVGGIHGDKRSRERIRILDSFKKNQINILIATDVAARGLDIPDVTHVINYDVPQTYDTYVHRIGRTGRAGKKGTALTFVPA